MALRLPSHQQFGLSVGWEVKGADGPSVRLGLLPLFGKIVIARRVLNLEDLTALNSAYTAVDEKPEVCFKCLKILVGERGFEPPTPWSRTRFQSLLKAVEICGPQVIAVEPVAGCSLKSIDPRGSLVL